MLPGENELDTIATFYENENGEKNSRGYHTQS